MTNNNQMFKQFNQTYQIEPIKFNYRNTDVTVVLIGDEHIEVCEELIDSDSWNPLIEDQINFHNVAKELTDILYITMQRMTIMGLNVDALLAEVHRSNMSKLVPMCDSIKELTIAKDRYPNAVYELVQTDAPDTIECNTMGVLRDKKTGKVIKPSCYSAAVITNEMIGI